MLEAALPSGIVLRVPVAADDSALARLMEAAYVGTIDQDLGDNDDGDVEIAEWRANGADAERSRVAEDDLGRLVGASLMSAARSRLLLNYVITTPAWKQQGVAGALLAASLTAVAELGEQPVVAGVTLGNEPSERLLRKQGFHRGHAIS